MKTESSGIQKVSNHLREAMNLRYVGEETEGFKERRTGPAVQ